MRINSVLDYINQGRGRGSSNQCYDVMYTVARAFQVQTIVEIGTHQGASAITFCQAIIDNGKTPRIHTVDSWIEEDMKARAAEHFRRAGFDQYITMVQGDSTIEIPLLFGRIGKVDLIFIDGDHSLGAVERDYENCKAFSNLIFFHDTRGIEQPYLTRARNDGWSILNFPTLYIEGNSQSVGIALAYK